MTDVDYVGLVLNDCYNYVNTVGFFYAFKSALDEHGIKSEVEHDFSVPGRSPPCRPDFAMLDGNRVTDVVEHKASISAPQHALDELSKVASKYRKLSVNGIESSPQVTVLYPLNKKEVIDSVRHKLPRDLTLCGFDQKTSDTEITFTLDGATCCKDLETLLNGNPLHLDTKSVYSKYKFIRHDPPTVYTACQLWVLFPTFLNIQYAEKEEYPVSRAELLRRSELYYPEWIRNNKQVNSNRVENALSFLHKIRYVNYDWDGDIIVFSRKGTKSGDVLVNFAEKYVEKHLKKPVNKRNARKRQPPSPRTIKTTRTLDEWV